jgi:dienelactone hydrolase
MATPAGAESMPFRLLATLALVTLLAAFCPPLAAQDTGIAQALYNFIDTRRAHGTRLLWQAPASQQYEEIVPPAGWRPVTYKSDDLELAAWLALPEGASGPVPGVVYAHGGFALATSELEDASPFLEAGLAVLVPTFRGENGNPGAFELFFGEVDDLAAAVGFLATAPGVDPARVYAFGHSSGGGLAALLALFPDVPLRASGSSGGLYLPQNFANWGEIRFPVTDPIEWELRAMLPHMGRLVRPHIAFLGDQDWDADSAAAIQNQAGRLKAPLQVILVEGDHWTALPASVQGFLHYIRGDAP